MVINTVHPSQKKALEIYYRPQTIHTTSIMLMLPGNRTPDNKEKKEIKKREISG